MFLPTTVVWEPILFDRAASLFEINFLIALMDLNVLLVTLTSSSMTAAYLGASAEGAAGVDYGHV